MFNTLKTLVLLGVLSAMIVALGGIVGGRSGVMFAFVFALVMNVGSYWFSAPLALRMSNAQPVDRSQAPELYQIVENLTRKANLPMPTVHMIPTQSANAFATGRDPNHSAVAVTEGIMSILNEREMEAVLAHELGHVRNRDILITSVAAVLASTVTMIAHNAPYLIGYGDRDDESRPNMVGVLLISLLAPLAATLVNLALSRSREYQADASGAKLCGDPMALASALQKVEDASQQIPMRSLNPALSSLYITNPDPRSWFVTLLSTHPSTADRIKRLELMAHGQSID